MTNTGWPPMLNKADSFEEGRISDVSDQCLFEVCVAVHDLLSPGAGCRGCHTAVGQRNQKCKEISESNV